MLLLLVVFVQGINGIAQTLGGNSLFNFLKSPATPQLTALGGIHISSSGNDVGMAYNNPSLLRENMNGQVNLAFSSFAGIKQLQAFGAWYHESSETTFGAGLNYFSYGSLNGTDDAGNILGEFKPRDMVFQVAASRKYSDRIHYGAALKLIQSNYGIYRSNAVAMDAGIHYADSTGWQFSLILKNMGAQLKTYAGTEKDGLPFDIQFGVSRQLSKAPIRLSLTAHHLHSFNLLYNDTAFNSQNGVENLNSTLNKTLNHLVIGVQVFPSKNLELSAGYNFLRRSELRIANGSNGLAGFSIGAGLLFKKFNFRYARSMFQKNIASNQLGINLLMSEYF
ncbi:MAG: type IX secretion system protein PorQ [Flavitalea sp.]